MPIASNRPSPRRAALAALLATATLALAACAGLQPKTPEDVVRERSEARWDALIKRDFDKAWNTPSPPTARSSAKRTTTSALAAPASGRACRSTKSPANPSAAPCACA